jgi:D-glycero-D-manno-heptose 1,7-bisphosphate phosphatase
MKGIAMKPAIFLDRDGTLIHDEDYLSDPKKVKYFSGAAEALRTLKKAGYLLVVVTNQSGVARGYYPESAVKRIHRKMKRDLSKRGAAPDAFFYCPHYPGGKVKSLSRSCACRKPKTGMVQQAQRVLPIDLKRSFMVGDKRDDMLLSVNARLAGGLLVRTGKGKMSEKELKKKNIPKTWVVSNLRQAVKKILSLDVTP